MLDNIKRRVNLLALAFGLIFTITGFCEGELSIPALVPYAEDSDVRQAIKDECQLSEKMSSYLGKYIASSTAVSVEPEQGKYLDLSITEVHATAGGAYSGSKWMVVTGRLKENGKPMASFVAKRTTRGGGWGACGAAQRCAKAISKDISKWIKKPEDGAKLGDAK